MNSKFTSKRLICIMTSLLILLNTNLLLTVGSTIDSTYPIEDYSPYTAENQPLETNDYTSDNCTRVGEFDNNFDFSNNNFVIVNLANRKIAFIAMTNNIVALDITKTTKSLFLSKIELSSIILFDGGLYFYGNLLYVTGLFGRIYKIDYSDLYNPIIVYDNLIEGMSSLRNIIVCDGYLYGMNSIIEFVKIDLENYETPKIIAKYERKSSKSKIIDYHLKDDTVFLIEDSSMLILDLNSEGNLTILGNFSLPTITLNFNDIFVKEDLAFLCNYDGSISVVDCLNKSYPLILTILLNSSIRFDQIEISDSYLYAIDSSAGLFTYDISNLFNVRLSSIYNNSEILYHKQIIDDSHLYILDDYSGLYLFSIEESNKPKLIAQYYLNGQSYDVAMKEDIILVANGVNGLEIYKMKINNDPVFQSRILVREYCQYVEIYNNYAYVYANYFMYIIDISNPTNPIIISQVRLSFELNGFTYYPFQFKVIDHYLFAPSSNHSYYIYNCIGIYDLAANKTSIELIDILTFQEFYGFTYHEGFFYITFSDEVTIYSYNSEILEEIATHNINNIRHEYYDIVNPYIANNLLFINTDDDLLVYNVSNPEDIELLLSFAERFNSTIEFEDICLNAHFLYLINDIEDRLEIYNFEHVSESYQEGYFDCNKSLSSLYIADDKVFLTSQQITLQIVQLNHFLAKKTPFFFVPYGVITTVLTIRAIYLTTPYLRRHLDQKKKHKKDKSKDEQDETIIDLDANDIIIEISRKDFDSEEIYEYAKEIFENKTEE